MNPGDMIVQSVREDLVVHDIRLSLPRGVAVVVPGNSFYDSRDLGKYMSEGRVVQLDKHPRLGNIPQAQPKPLDPPEPPKANPELVSALDELKKTYVNLRVAEAENNRLRAELDESQKECGRLLAECSQLREELNRLRNSDSKLEAILTKIDNLPAQTVVVASKEEATSGVTIETPMFISQEVFEDSKVKVQSKHSEIEGPPMGDTLKALRKIRKPKGS